LTSFQSMGLAPELYRALAEEGFSEPTPIQQKAIPLVLEGRDLMAAAQTGTGKTAAFGYPILHMLKGGRSAGPRALVLVPTRELAMQVEGAIRTYSRYLRFRTAVIYGGVGIFEQIDRLRRGVDLIVATPGRLLDHVQRRTVNLSGIEKLVLDEADRMLDMGFIPDIRRIVPLLSIKRQTLLFSATLNSGIRDLARGLLQNPAVVEIAPENITVEQISQRCTRSIGYERPNSSPTWSRRATGSRCWCSRARSTVLNGLLSNFPGMASIRPPFMATGRKPPVPGRWLILKWVGFAFWWPPTSLPAASTLSNYPTLSTMNFQAFPKTTFTGLAEPAGQVAWVRRYRW